MKATSRSRVKSPSQKSATGTITITFVVPILLALITTHCNLCAEAVSLKEIDVNSVDTSQWRLCSERVPHYETPCLCAMKLQSVDPVDGALILNGSDNHIMFNCDHVSLSGNVPALPTQLPIRGYSHRHGGFQMLDQQVFSESQMTLQWVDFSYNHLHRLTDRFLEGVKSTLEELLLGHNYLGLQLNPIFATNAFKPLLKLKILDLSYNMIRALDDGLFDGMDALEELHLAGNHFNMFPKLALQNLPRLATICFQHNYIDKLHSGDFSGMETLRQVNMSHNIISIIESGAFSGLQNLTSLDLSSNLLTVFSNQDVFQGIEGIEELDLSDNSLGAVPSNALRSLKMLTVLRLSFSGIRSLKLDDFAELSSLEILDLSRNRITELPPTVFARLSNLNALLLDVNLLLKVDEPAFEGLQNLHQLSLNDNTVLGFPTRALASLSSLDHLAISYNRITAISHDLFGAIKNLKELYFEFNLVREVPDDTFHNFTELQQLSFRGNQIETVSKGTFAGLEHTLQKLDLSINKLSEYPSFSEFHVLETLDLSDNNLSFLPEDALATLPAIKSLSLRRNRLTNLVIAVTNPMRPSPLEHLNLGENSIDMLIPDMFTPLPSLMTVDMSWNSLNEIEENTFYSIPNLEHLDLSHNMITIVHPKAFGPIINMLRTIKLNNNQMTVLDGGIFTTPVPTLQVLDLGNNHIHHLMPNSFLSMPSLRHTNLGGNKLTQFLDGILGELPYLEHLSIQRNHLQQVDSGQFSHARRLRDLDLSYNNIETLGEGIFYNSSQVKQLNLSHNRLTTLPQGSFDGLTRLQLDLSYNNLTSLPVGIFSRKHVASLQSIDLSHNDFTRLPLSALSEQYGSLEDLIVNNNHVTHVPSNDNTLINIKHLDLSSNPLSDESLQNIFSEPKTVRELELANCGIKTLPSLETPFICLMNLSNNAISSLQQDVFRRTTLLETLDLSGNSIANLTSDLSPVWPTVTGLKHLRLSRNKLKELGPKQFSHLPHLESLSLSHLHQLGRFDDNALSGLLNLKSLSIHGYPRLGFYDIRGILESISTLESLEVEMKTAVLREQLQLAYNSRLRRLALYGMMLKNLTSVSFAGLLSSEININIHDTSLTTIPNTIFLPLPASGRINLNLADNHITKLGPQMLMTLGEKRHNVDVTGLERNPLFCDCLMKPMHKWLQDRMQDGDEKWKHLKCSSPEELAGHIISELRDEDLTCERPTTTTSTMSTTTVILSPTTTEQIADIFHEPVEEEEEPDIIYEAPSPRPHPSDSAIQGSLTNMDSMIIGIIVGVVAFICILIIIICIIKLRHSRVRYRASPMHMPPITGTCTCRKPSLQGSANHGTLRSHCPTSYPPLPGHHGTKPPKLQAIQNGTGSVSSLPQSGYYHSNQPYYVTYPESDVEYR